MGVTSIPPNAIFLDPCNEKQCKWFKRWRRLVKITGFKALYGGEGQGYIGEILHVKKGLFSKWFIKKSAKFFDKEEIVMTSFSIECDDLSQ